MACELWLQHLIASFGFAAANISICLPVIHHFFSFTVCSFSLSVLRRVARMTLSLHGDPWLGTGDKVWQRSMSKVVGCVRRRKQPLQHFFISWRSWGTAETMLFQMRQSAGWLINQVFTVEPPAPKPKHVPPAMSQEDFPMLRKKFDVLPTWSRTKQLLLSSWHNAWTISCCPCSCCRFVDLNIQSLHMLFQQGHHSQAGKILTENWSNHLCLPLPPCCKRCCWATPLAAPWQWTMKLNSQIRKVLLTLEEFAMARELKLASEMLLGSMRGFWKGLTVAKFDALKDSKCCHPESDDSPLLNGQDPLCINDSLDLSIGRTTPVEGPTTAMLRHLAVSGTLEARWDHCSVEKVNTPCKEFCPDVEEFIGSVNWTYYS